MRRTFKKALAGLGMAVLFFLIAAPLSFSADSVSSAEDAAKSSVEKASPAKPGSDWLKGRDVERPDIPQPGTRKRPPGMPEPGEHKHVEMSDPSKFKHPEMSKREPKKRGSSSIKEMEARIKMLEEKITEFESRIKELEKRK